MARLVVVSGGIMMLGLIAVFAAIVYKLGQPAGAGDAFAARTVEAPIALPRGARVVAADLDGNRALLTLETEAGSTLLLIDLATGNVLGRYVLAPK